MEKNKNQKNIRLYLNKHKIAVFVYILTLILACASSGASTLLFANFLSRVTIGKYYEAVRFLILAGSATVICRFSWWYNYCHYIKYANIIWKEMAKDLTKRSFELSTSTFTNNNSGTFVQRIMNDPKDILDKLSTVVESMAETFTNFIIVAYIISLNWIIGLLYVFTLIVCFTVETVGAKINKKQLTKSKKINDKTYSLVNEIVESEKDIKALGLEEKLFESTDMSFEAYKKQKIKQNVVQTSFWNTRNLLLEVFGIIILAVGISLMKLDIITLATYILVYSYRGNLYYLCWSVGAIIKGFTEISVSCSRMFAMFDETKYPAEKFGNKVLKNSKGKIEFKNVQFAYAEVKEKEDEESKKKQTVEMEKKEPIFTELSFVVEPNTSVAFVGKSGSGKSTILSLIAKLNEADKGEIKIDDINIKKISKFSLKENISLINQFPYIFDMTIKENLLLVKKDATDDEIWEVLHRASFDEDVKAMPKGIDTKVGESGVKLSGGQRQRLAIARALLKQSKIILFDESTSSLDNFAQSHIQKSIENMKGQHTIVIVAHRLSTIKNVDKIYFLENGKICDSGTFNELFEKNEQFKKMFLSENI